MGRIVDQGNECYFSISINDIHSLDLFMLDARVRLGDAVATHPQVPQTQTFFDTRCIVDQRRDVGETRLRNFGFSPRRTTSQT
jgi:hypothetical protein